MEGFLTLSLVALRYYQGGSCFNLNSDKNRMWEIGSVKVLLFIMVVLILPFLAGSNVVCRSSDQLKF